MYLTVVAAAWLLLAPTAVGGQTTYVIVDGNSMEPGMHRGDLAMLRQRESYAVGAVATYRHPVIGPVIHRIIGREGDRFVFQGDNNDFIDPYRPRQDELIGEMSLFIPRAGTLLTFLRKPPVFAGLAAVCIGTATMATSSLPLRQRRRSEPARAKDHDRAALLSTALTAALTLGVAALALAGLAFSKPLTRTVEQAVPFTQQATFDYSAPAPSELYDGGAARGGDPIFRRLADSVVLTTTYTFAAAAPVEMTGSAQLRVVVGDGAGWRRTLALGPATPFSGSSVTLAGTLDLATIEAVLRSYEAQTGIRQAGYQVALAPVYQIHGSVGGAPLATSYSPRLGFIFDEARLRPVLDEPDGALVATEDGTLTVSETVPGAIALWLLRLDVLTARRLALVSLEVALVGGLLAGWQLARQLRRDPLAATRLRFGTDLVRASAGTTWARDAVTLGSLDDLAQVARRSGQPIIEVEHGAERGYYVREGSMVYGCCLHAHPGAEER